MYFSFNAPRYLLISHRDIGLKRIPYQMLTTLAVVLVGAAGAVALVGIATILIRFYILHGRTVSRTSETNSSDPSLQVGQNVELPLRGGISYPSDLQGARCFLLEELNQATKNFSSINLIGTGNFGEVYKGLLPDMVVAIKKRPAAPSQEFIQEVQKLSCIRHRNLVSLLGYCQENDLQMLVYEYVPNGSISTHLYGSSHTSNEKLEFKHRLSIACRAAKGLAHLHSLNPPVVHMDFKTANVLVDENFIPKVADAGLRNLLSRNGGVGTSQITADDAFLDPGARESKVFTEKSDVYSFGVFLLELVSGQEAMQLQFPFVGPYQSITEWAQSYCDSSDISTIIDPRMASSFTAEGMRELLQLTAWCVSSSSGRRPPMSFVVSELDRILEKERSLTTIMGEGNPNVTLGSELFIAS